MGVEFIPGGDVRLLGTHLEHEDDAGYRLEAMQLKTHQNLDVSVSSLDLDIDIS